MAPVLHPLLLRPFVGRGRKHQWLTAAAAEIAHRALYGKIPAARCRRQRRIYVQHDFRLWMDSLDVPYELEGSLGLSFRILRGRQHEGELRYDTVAAAFVDGFQ